MTRDKIALVLVCAGLGAFGAGGVIAGNQIASDTNKAIDTSMEVQRGIEAACESYNNPLRRGLRENAEIELKQSQSIRYDKFFPNIPKRVLEAARERERKRLEYNINHRYRSLNCKKAYK